MKCSRCGSAVNSVAKYCGLCRRPLDAPAGWEIPEHDAGEPKVLEGESYIKSVSDRGGPR